MDREALRAAMEQTAAAAASARPITIPKWGKVYVRDVTVAEVNVETAEETPADKKTRLARSACRVLCDEAGNRLFDPKNEADVALLLAQPWSLLQKVLSAADSTGNA